MNYILVSKRRLKLAMDELYEKLKRTAQNYVDSRIRTAVDAASAASQAASRAEEQVQAMADVVALAGDISEAVENANNAAAAAAEAVSDVQEAIASASLGIPESMEVECPTALTLGNVEPKRIKAVLYPLATSLQNIIFISDNKAVSVMPDGTIHINGVGSSEVQVIPALKTSLARTFRITVTDASIRLVTGTSLRLLSGGTMRLS